MCELSEEELGKWVPNFDELPFRKIYTDPNFIETMWHICVLYEYVSQHYETLETSLDLLKIYNWV